jgi:hypothetical protein
LLPTVRRSLVAAALFASPLFLAQASVPVSAALRSEPLGPVADAEPAAALPDGIETNKIKRHLSWFMGDSSPLSFGNEASTVTITIPQPADIKIKSVKLDLTGIASTALEAKASSILVSVNDKPATTIPLDGARPNINEILSLPGNLFTTGYNQVSFRAILTTGRICEKFNAPPLWARISAASRVSIDTTPRAVVPRFDRLSAIFDKHTLLHAETVTILYNEEAADHPSTIIGTAEGIGLRLDYVPVHVRARPLSSADLAQATARPGTVIVLAPHSTHDSTQSDKAASLTLTATTSGGTLLRITGSDIGVAMAGRLIGSGSIAWPDASSARIETDGLLTPTPRHEPGHDLYLRALGVPTSTLDSSLVDFKPVTFWNEEWGGRAIVTVHLAYGNGAKPGTALNVYANDIFVGGIPLDKPTGGVYGSYKLSIPRTVLLPGKNVLQFRGVVNRQTSDTGTCGSESPAVGIPVTLYGDSYIGIFGGARLKPDNLAALTTVEFVPHRMLIAGSSPGVLSAAATIAAKIAQVDKTTDLQANTFTPGSEPRNAIVVGAFGALPANMLQQAGVLPAGGQLAIREELGTVTAEQGPSAFTALPNWMVEPLQLEPPDIIGNGRQMTIAGYGDATVMAMLPSEPTGTVIIAARTGVTLAAGAADLVGWDHWSQLAGHIAVIKPGAKHLAITQSTIYLANLRGQAGYYASRHTGIAITLLVFGLILVTALVSITLRIRTRRRHRITTEQERRP